MRLPRTSWPGWLVAGGILSLAGCAAPDASTAQAALEPQPPAFDCTTHSCAAGAGSDAGATPETSVTCAPADVTNFSPTFPSSLELHRGACTPEHIAAYYRECLGAEASAAKCSAFTSSGWSYARCVECLQPAPSTGVLGAVIDDHGTRRANVAGCVEGSTNSTIVFACGHAIRAKLECTNAACVENCRITDRYSSIAFDECVKASEKTACAKYVKAAAACVQALEGEAMACTAGKTFDEQYQNVATLMCGS